MWASLRLSISRYEDREVGSPGGPAVSRLSNLDPSEQRLTTRESISRSGRALVTFFIITVDLGEVKVSEHSGAFKTNISNVCILVVL
jgi:hypothetical protein